MRPRGPDGHATEPLPADRLAAAVARGDLATVHAHLMQGAGEQVAKAARRAGRDLLALTCDWQEWVVRHEVARGDVERGMRVLMAQIGQFGVDGEL